MIKSDPVIKVEALDARKTAILFNSSTFPRRFIGVREHHIFFWASRAGTRFKAVSAQQSVKTSQNRNNLGNHPYSQGRWNLVYNVSESMGLRGDS